MPSQETGRVFGSSRTEQTIKNQIRSTLPTPYESGVGVFGGRFEEKHGRLLFVMRGVDITSVAGTLKRQKDSIDRVGDRLLRRFDDHVMSDKVAQWVQTHMQHIVQEAPFAWLNKLSITSKRSRGGPKQIVSHAEELRWEEEGRVRSMGELYGEYREFGALVGLEVKDQNLFKQGASFQDIIRGDAKNVEVETDRWKLYREVGKFIRNIHAHSAVGIGELLAADIMLYMDNGNQRMALNIPDIMYRVRPITLDKTSLSDSLVGIPSHVRMSPSRSEQQATDLLDLLTSVAFEEYRRSTGEKLQDEPTWHNVAQALSSVVEGYLSGPEDVRSFRTDGKVLNPDAVMKATKSLAYRGRLTLQGDEEIVAKAKSARGSASDSINSHSHLQAFHDQYRYGLDEISSDVSAQRALVGNIRRSVFDALGIQYN